MSDQIDQNNKKLDLMINTNVAQILTEESKTRLEVRKIANKLDEVNEKLDKHIEQNEAEHQRFDYEIAELKMQTQIS